MGPSCEWTSAGATRVCVKRTTHVGFGNACRTNDILPLKRGTLPLGHACPCLRPLVYSVVRASLTWSLDPSKILLSKDDAIDTKSPAPRLMCPIKHPTQSNHPHPGFGNLLLSPSVLGNKAPRYRDLRRLSTMLTLEPDLRRFANIQKDEKAEPATYDRILHSSTSSVVPASGISRWRIFYFIFRCLHHCKTTSTYGFPTLYSLRENAFSNAAASC